jgi:hypothetical protein
MSTDDIHNRGVMPANPNKHDIGMQITNARSKTPKTNVKCSFGEPPSDTSLAAVESIDEETMSRRMRRIFVHIKAAADGATCWEVEQALGMLHQTTSSYIRKLFMNGCLRDTTKRRPTGSGRMAIVWEAA